MFLVQRGYPKALVHRHIRVTRRIDAKLREQRCQSIGEVTRENLRVCAPPSGRAHDDARSSAVVRLLETFLDEQGLLPPPEPSSPAEQKLAEYGRYLHQVRGLAPPTIPAHLATASQFVPHLGGQGGWAHFPRLIAAELEGFVQQTGHRVSRATLQHTVAHLRSLLRFLAAQGEIPVGLDTQIDTPRVYRGEQLPRALPWATVSGFLGSIDRSTPLGKRDYAMFQLIVNYGLRASEVVGLCLDDVQWRAGRLLVTQCKTATPLELPLTDAVGASLVRYLRRGRPQGPYREIFLRHRAPAGVLKPTAVTEAFQAWSRRSGLAIPFQGAHCLRHSYAIHLLRQGASLRTIGAILGHRSAESTCVYLRFAVEDLREVALDLPSDALEEGGS